MTNIKALDKLRRAVKKGKAVAFPSGNAYYDAIDECMDAIEHEVSERYIELPVDADGVPWHMGDEVRRTNHKDLPSIVTGIYLYADGIHKLYVPETACTAWTPYASKYHHVKPRTLEDVLHDFWEEWESHPTDAEWGTRLERLRESEAKYADEIRDLMGVSE